MKTRSIVLLTVIVMILPNSAYSQFGALKRAINKQIEHKVDSSVDKRAQDDINKKQKEEGQQANSDKSADATGGMTRGLFGGNIDIKHNDEYSFTGRIYMIMETYDKKDPVKADYYTYYNTNTINNLMR